MRSRLAVVLVPVLLLVACAASGDLEIDRAAQAEGTPPDEAAASGAEGPTDAEASSDATPDTAAPEPAPEVAVDVPPAGAPARGAPASDRIVVATSNGQLYLIDPDGGERLDLTAAGVALQPVWSPDGRRIAWSQRDGSGFSITSANADGSERRRAATLFSGYFGYWSPTSNWLAFLGNAPPGTGLVLDGGTESELDAVVDSDTFYYFSWSPDGSRWFVHSGSGLSIVTLDGNRTPVDLDDAQFRAPIWADDGSVLIAVDLADRNVIVELDPDTGDFDELVDVGDITNFVLDPTGRYLAIESVVFADGEVDPGDGITVSASSQPAPGSEVLVYDRMTGDVRQVLDERTGGFWWSPDGTTLAVLVRDRSAPDVLAQWLLWRPSGSFRTAPFGVTPLFGSTYIPFFDQFAQSVTPWAPDSSRFVYSAFDGAGEPGVFVQPARPDTAAVRISDDAGVAFWSPT